MPQQPEDRRRRPFRCWLGFHRWEKHTDGWEHTYTCTRCPATPKPCTNCGKQHDPNAITVCVVTRTTRW